MSEELLGKKLCVWNCPRNHTLIVKERKGKAMEKDRKPPMNNPPSEKGVEVMEQMYKEKEEAMKKSKLYEDVQKEGKVNIVSIVNDWTDTYDDDVPPKQIQISDYYYAFVEDKNGFELWVKSYNDKDEDWVVVSDLTGIYVFEYKIIHKYAVAIGWIDEDKDLFI